MEVPADRRGNPHPGFTVPVEDWRELLPTAYLLTGSDAGARDLLVRALARGPRLDDLVRVHLRRRLARDTAIDGTSGNRWWLSAEDVATAGRTAAALDGLSRIDRTAAALRWHEGLAEDRVAALVPGVDLSTLPARLGIPPADLPRRLEGLAALADVRDLADDDVARGVREVRVRRRSRALPAVGAVAVLTAGAVWLPGAPADPAGTRPDTGRATAAPSVPSSGPARGSLVDDEEFVAALRARLAPGEDAGRLVYAGDAAGMRWALLARQAAGALETQWFTGPAGAAAADLDRSASVAAGRAAAAWSVAVDRDGRSALLVLAEPGDEVEVSAGFDVAPDGSASRTFDRVDGEDGVAAVELDRASAAGVRYRIARDDVVVATETPEVLVSDVVTTAPPAPARSGTEPIDPTAFYSALGQITGPTGRTGGDLGVTVLGSGRYPAPGGAAASAVTVAAVLPGGAVVTSTAVATSGPGDGTTTDRCGTETHPAGTDVASLTVVTRCASYAGDSSTFGVTVVVVAPPGVPVTLNSASGGEPVTPELASGWGYVLATGLTQFAADGAPGEVSRAGDGPFDSP